MSHLYNAPYQTMFNYDRWTDLTLNATTSYDDMQVQQVEFPTPPTTPPKSITIASPVAAITPPPIHIPPPPHQQQQQQQQQQHRTKSVIMKVGHQGYMPQCTTVERVAIKNIDLLQHCTGAEDDCAGTIDVESQKDYYCNWINCGKYFQSLNTLAAHVTQEHASAAQDGLFYCRWLGCLRIDRGFNARYKMLVHVRTHTKEKPHHCHLCEKSFSRAENLKIHIRSHSGEKPYSCSYPGCKKAYSNSSDRFKHTRTHSMEKPYMCKVPGCQKRYTDPSSLRKHVKTFKHSLYLIQDARTDAKTHILTNATKCNANNNHNNINYNNNNISHNNILREHTISPSYLFTYAAADKNYRLYHDSSSELETDYCYFSNKSERIQQMNCEKANMQQQETQQQQHQQHQQLQLQQGHLYNNYDNVDDAPLDLSIQRH